MTMVSRLEEYMSTRCARPMPATELRFLLTHTVQQSSEKRVKSVNDHVTHSAPGKHRAVATKSSESATSGLNLPHILQMRSHERTSVPPRDSW